MERIGIIGGSGLANLHALKIERYEMVRTPFGEPSAPLTFGNFDGRPVVFLPRHGAGHRLPPHKVNYRANIWALHSVGVTKVVAMAAVGGITAPPPSLCIPDQVIDYTWGRDHTFFEKDLTEVTHIDFTEPYCEEMRQALLSAGKKVDAEITDGGVYGTTQGPRLESAAEIDRMERDGCTLVGMTGMPEAALAKELELCYACFAVIVNWAAGRSDGPITMEEIERNLNTGMATARNILSELSI